MLQSWIISVFKDIPTEAVILFFVIVPSIISILAITYRILLYNRLRELSNWAWTTKSTAYINAQAPQAIQRIRKNYEETIEKLDNVNTLALIDHIYSTEKVGRVSCEQVEYLTKVLPNLLISLGLLGTFIGLTINLVSIGEINSDLNIADIQSRFSTPLSGMSIAFISSLVALAWGIALTLINSLFNTGLAKHRFMVAIEFYLDNDLSAVGKDQTSRIVAGMAAALDNFLLRFGETVKQAVQDSLGAEVEKMVAANKEASQLAQEVNAKFLDASGNIVTGANTFQQATSALNDGRFSEKFTQASTNLVTAQTNLVQFTESLNHLADKLNNSITASNTTNQEVVFLCNMIRNLEYKMTQVLDAVDTNQTNFSHVAENLKQGSRDFLAFKDALTDLLTQVEQTQANVNAKSTELANIQDSLAKLTSFFDQSQKEITSAQATLSSAITALVTEQQTITRNLNENATQLNNQQTNLNAAITATNDLNQTLERNRKENTDQLYTLFNESYQKITSIQDNFSAAITNLTQQHQTQLNTLKQGLEQLLKLIRQANEDHRSDKNTLDKTLTALERQVATLNSHIQRLERHHSTLANHSQTIGDGLTSANALLETIDTQAIYQTLQQINTRLSNFN